MGSTSLPAPVSSDETDGVEDSKVHYPSVYLYDIKGLSKLPKKGRAVIEFDVRSVTRSNQDGVESCSMEMEIKSIESESCDSEDEEAEGDNSRGDRSETEESIESFFKEK